MTANFWFVCLAGLGGVIVLIGLLMELFAEKDWFTNVKSFRRCACVKLAGECIVIIGILVEIGVAVWSALFELQNEPINQPVAEIKAIAVIDVNATNSYPVDFSVLQDTHLELTGTNLYGESYFALIPETFPRQFIHKRFSDNAVTFVGYAIDFEQNPVPPFEFNNFTNFVKSRNPTVKEALKEIQVVRFYINFIPKYAQILAGM